jgi:hypothetical protein
MEIKFGNQKESAAVKYLTFHGAVMASDMTQFSFLRKAMEEPLGN